MNIDKRWFLPLAVVVAAGAVAGAAIGWKARRGFRRTAHDLECAEDLKSWENEGGNLATIPLTAGAAGSPRAP